MAYNLSPRWKKIISQTPVTLGPNQYFIDNDQFVRKNSVPFLSSSKKELKISDSKIYTDAMYTLPRLTRIIGGSSMRSKAERKTLDVKKAPGPSGFDPKLAPPKICSHKQLKPGRGKRLYVCSVPYTLEAKGPSVPSKLDENGYELSDDGKLIKVPADEHDTTIGPAFYSVQTTPTMTTLMYKGCEWWKRKSDRNWIAISKNPGPGTYNIDVPKKPFIKRDEYVREMARLYSYVPRFLDAMQTHLVTEDLPGPANYNVQISKKASCSTSLSLNPAAFMSRASRFERPKIGSPSPSKYNLMSSLVKQNISLEGVAFNIKCPRFLPGKKFVSPGPMNYAIHRGSIEENLCKTMMGHTQPPAFNQSQERDVPYITAEQCSFPGPTQYDVTNLDGEERKCVDSSVFKSVTKRFDDKAHLRSGEPARLNISEHFNKNRDRKSYNVGKVGFLSTLSRRKVFKPTSYYNPSPATYLSQRPMETKGGFTVKLSPRFREPHDNDNPGPGYYNIHPQHETSTFKTSESHSMVLKENIVRMKLRLPPGKTRDGWFKDLRKHRKLRVFQRPPIKRLASWIDI